MFETTTIFSMLDLENLPQKKLGLLAVNKKSTTRSLKETRRLLLEVIIHRVSPEVAGRGGEGAHRPIKFSTE